MNVLIERLLSQNAEIVGGRMLAIDESAFAIVDDTIANSKSEAFLPALHKIRDVLAFAAQLHCERVDDCH